MSVCDIARTVNSEQAIWLISFHEGIVFRYVNDLFMYYTKAFSLKKTHGKQVFQEMGL